MSKDNLDKLNKVCTEYFGLESEEIVEFAKGLLDFYNSNTWIVSTHEIFPKTIQKFFNKDEVILKNFILHHDLIKDTLSEA